MNDMASTIIAKSDQLNADDLLSGPITVKIRETKVAGSGEQPVSIFYEGENNKAWKPCKSMCRVMVAFWGPDSKKYIGKSITLFRDPDVTWAGMKVAGIRISHMSDIDGEKIISLTKSQGNKKPWMVKPLILTIPLTPEEIADMKNTGEESAAKGMDALKGWWQGLGKENQKQLGAAFLDEMKTIAAGIDSPDGTVAP